jgi:hypothetical protein
MSDLIRLTFWFLAGWILASLCFGCTTIVVQPITTPTPIATNLWPAPIAGCPAYQITVNSQVPGNTFDPHNDSDMAALKAVIVGCSGQYGTRSQCLINLIKLDRGRYHAVCGEKR